MQAVETSPSPVLATDRPWQLAWLTPWRCRMILVLVLAAGFLLHLHFLTNNCPLDLSGDEAYYWDWSRQLDWSYFSKGPLIACIIRASCAIFGDTMPAVRYPALALGVGTSLLTYWLSRKLFSSDRIALGAVLLNHFVPMYIAGSMLMTIDPPFFFCWAAATCLATKAILDGRKWAWVATGVAVGTGFLAKYTMMLWLAGFLIFMLVDRDARRNLLTRWPWITALIASVFTIPVIVWNWRHGWASARLVASETGAQGGGFNPLNTLEFIGAQAGIIGPALAVILVAAVLYALRSASKDDPHRRSMRYLLTMGLPLWTIIGLWSLRSKIQPNWPAPSYFTLVILATYFLSTRLASRETWRRWRGWVWGTVLPALLLMPLVHNTEVLYGPVRKVAIRFAKKPKPLLTDGRWDPSFRLRGWSDLGAGVSKQLHMLPAGSFVLCEKYEFCGAAAFYTEGQPKTYYLGSWFTDPERRTGYSQYDMWPDRSLDRPELIGRDAVYVGYGRDRKNPSAPADDLAAAFERVEPMEDCQVIRRGLVIRTFHMWRCHGFKGVKRPVK